MAIRFKCENGHALVAGDGYSGHAMRCPVCERAVVVPNQAVDAPERDRRNAMTDTNVVRLLSGNEPPGRRRIWA